ncbi:uncharacterized protein LOC132048844 [Lycium ferocissimum]|uniref:uncharacterized protein LOC132048844 n=1 Tax=Lycium ferocissimum TaxID=112874 RepID=UPI00281568D5|nr:uncharacterized protein LOC132048844 [Lycium ferocissimum]
MSDTSVRPRLSEYNFNILSAASVAAIDHIKDTRWPRPLRTAHSQQDPNLICDYHGTHGHRNDDYKGLRDEVARLLKKGHLLEFLSKRAKNHFKNRETNKKTKPEKTKYLINMIVGGVEIPRGPMTKKTKFSITREKRSRDYVPDEFISFSDEDAEGSSTNIIQWKVVEQLELLDQIVPASQVLNGFNMAYETTKGKITLPVNAATVVQHTKFYLIDGEMRYNAFLRRPWLHIMRVVPSTLHQMLKFPTPKGVKIIHGEQPAAKEMFAVEEAVQTPMTNVHEDVNESKNTK